MGNPLYPLVEFHIAMENHHFTMENHHFTGQIEYFTDHVQVRKLLVYRRLDASSMHRENPSPWLIPREYSEG
jgi:hypothetical protein